MPRLIGPVLDEMVDAIEGIERATRDIDLDAFSGDWLVKHAVERALEIVSEAARHIPEALIETEPDIPWRAVRSLGNVLRHEYHRVSDRIIWAVVVSDLPRLKAALSRLRRRVGQEED